jgi:probable F420-dependent oxidoreductase
VHRLRFGVSCGIPSSGADWAERARRYEDAGVATMLVADHLGGVLSPLPALAAAAAVTTTLRVGPLVLNNDFRNPAVLAWEAATVDVLSDGRLELGLGAGHMRSEYDLAGIAFDRAAVRVARLTAAVDTLKAIWGDPGSGCPPCVQQPHPPLLIGGNGPRLLDLAAREADIVAFTGFSPRKGGTHSDLNHFRSDGLAAQVEAVRTAAGDRFDALELSALVQRVVVTDDRQGEAENLSGQFEGRLSPEQVLDSPYLLIGSHSEIADTLAERRERFGVSYWTIFERNWDAFAPVLTRLA